MITDQMVDAARSLFGPRIALREGHTLLNSANKFCEIWATSKDGRDYLYIIGAGSYWDEAFWNARGRDVERG